MRQVWKDEKENDELLDDYEGPVFVSRLPRECFIHEAAREACVHGWWDDDSDDGSEEGGAALVPSLVLADGSCSGDEMAEDYHSEIRGGGDMAGGGSSDGGSDGGSDDSRDAGRALILEPVFVETEIAYEFPLALGGGEGQGEADGQGRDDGPGNGDATRSGPVAEPELVMASETSWGVGLDGMAVFDQQSASGQTEEEVSGVKVEAITVEDVMAEDVRAEEIKDEDIKVEEMKAEDIKVEEGTHREQILVNNSFCPREPDGAMVKREYHPKFTLIGPARISVKRERSESAEPAPRYSVYSAAHPASHAHRPETPARLTIKRERSLEEDEEMPLKIRERDFGSRATVMVPKHRSKVQTAARERVMER